MTQTGFSRTAALIGSLLAASALATPAIAQSSAASPVFYEGDDIVITARHRAETLISVPVAASSVGASEIQRRGISSVDNLVTSVPQLIIADAGSSTQGGVVLIRGIGVGESNPFADQAVSFNVDGMQISRANIRRMSEVDMAQIDVLKGPQALFFGKNSPAGIIVIRTADPGNEFEAGVNASYEMVASEVRTDAFISSPITDSFGIRVVGYYSDMDGYFKNVSRPFALYGPTYRRMPQNEDYGGRVTLRYDDGGDFDARFKFNYGRVESSGPESSMQAVDCPLGYNQHSPSIPNSCKADDRIVFADPGPAIGNYNDDFADVGFVKQEQILTNLELNYQLTETLKLTSVTGYYRNDMRFVSSLTVADSSNPASILVSSQDFEVKEFSQELRLASSFDGPLNFLIGGYYQDADLRFYNTVILNAVTPILASPRRPVHQDGKAFSAFGQLMWQVTDTIELSGGGRYSHEKKDYALFDGDGNPLSVESDGNKWNNFSPEATLAWRPNDDLTIYGAYKTGFLSGGFAVASGNLALDRSYDQQKVRGFEAGVKGRAFDNRLTGSITAYRYVNLGLQVTANIVHPVFGVDQRIVNAGRAVNQGVEAEASFRPLDGLTVRAAAAYNHARYKQLITTCYAGQSIAQGCNLTPNAAGVYTEQDLSGARMVRAPDWTLQGGVAYLMPVGNEDELSFSADANFSSGFYGSPNNKPGSWQKSYATVDAGVMYTNNTHGFSVGFLARNLTDQYYFSRAIDSTFTGAGAGTAVVTPSDTIASVSRGRQFLVRVGLRFR